MRQTYRIEKCAQDLSQDKRQETEICIILSSRACLTTACDSISGGRP